jgi:hypothetical protein
MQALPSIAFGGFSGSAKGVTARQVAGRTILSVKSWPTGQTTNAQVARRTSMSKISKSWKLLSNDQMREWDRLAEHTSGQSAFGQKAEISGMNLYIRLNVNRAMAGEALLSTAPLSNVSVPNVIYNQVAITPELVVFGGITHEPSPYKLVLKMSASQSAGVSNGWSKTVIITPGMEDDWGEADVTTLYLKTIGVQPVPGQKVFIEAYWLDTSTGFAGQPIQEYAIVTGESPYQRRVKATMDNLDPTEESHVATLDVDFSTGAPVALFNAQCLGHSNVASSEVYLDQQLPADVVGTGMAIGRSNDDDGHINAQSYLVYMYNRNGKSQMTFAHRGGTYYTHTEVFGTGIIY